MNRRSLLKLPLLGVLASILPKSQPKPADSPRIFTIPCKGPIPNQHILGETYYVPIKSWHYPG